jgi:AraC-like DNA-binding protein
MTFKKAISAKSIPVQGAKWLKFHPATRSECLNARPQMENLLSSRGVSVAGVDRLKGFFYVGTPKSPTHLLWFVCAGRVTCDWGDGPRLLRKGDLAICPAGTPHWIKLASPRAKGLWFHLRPEAAWNFLGHEEPHVRLSREMLVMEMLMDGALGKFGLCPPSSAVMAGHYVELLLLHLKRELQKETSLRDNLFRERLDRLMLEVEEHLEWDWSVEKLTERLNLSPGYLHKMTLKHLGLRPMQWVTQLRLQRSVTLLTNTDLSLAQIAEKLGYGTPYSFSNAFRQWMGARPGAFRHGAAPVPARVSRAPVRI